MGHGVMEVQRTAGKHNTARSGTRLTELNLPRSLSHHVYIGAGRRVCGISAKLSYWGYICLNVHTFME